MFKKLLPFIILAGVCFVIFYPWEDKAKKEVDEEVTYPWER